MSLLIKQEVGWTRRSLGNFIDLSLNTESTEFNSPPLPFFLAVLTDDSRSWF